MRPIEPVPRFREHENILVGRGEPVRYALPHRVRLVPDYRRPQPPPVVLKREGDSPGHPHQIFGLQIPVPTTTVGIPQIDPADAVFPQHPPHLTENLDDVGHVEPNGRFQSQRTQPGSALPAERRSWHPVPAVGVQLLGSGFAVARSGARGDHTVRPVVGTLVVATPHTGRQTKIAQVPVRRRRNHAVHRFVRQWDAAGVGVVKASYAVVPILQVRHRPIPFGSQPPSVSRDTVMLTMDDLSESSGG